MARPFKFDIDDAYDRIIELLWSHGMATCSIKFVSEKLGITRSSFYNAFGNQDEMLIEALTRYELQSLEFALAIASPPIDVKFFLSTLLREMVVERTGDPARRGCLSANLLGQIGEGDDHLSNWLQRQHQEKCQHVEKILGWAVQAKDLPRNYDCAAAATQLLALIAGVNGLAKLGADADQLNQFVNRTLAALSLLE